MIRSLKHAAQLVGGEAGIAQQGAERPFGDLGVIGHHQPPMGRFAVAEDDVASTSPIDLVSELGEDFHQLPTGQDRQRAHTATSMISSWMAGGIASPCSRRLSR